MNRTVRSPGVPFARARFTAYAAVALAVIAAGASPAVAQSADPSRHPHGVEVQRGVTHTGDLTASGADVSIDGRVEGNVLARDSSVRLGDKALITGDLVLINSDLDSADPGAVKGHVIRFREDGGSTDSQPALSAPPAAPEAPAPPSARRHHSLYGDWVQGQVVFVACGLVLALLALVIAPRASVMAVSAIDLEPVRCLVVGAIGMAAIGLLSAVNAALFYTVVWIPVGIALFAAAGASLAFAGLLGIAYLGGRTARRLGWSAPAFFGRAALGLVALAIVNCIPVLNLVSTIIEMGTLVLGIGALIITGWGRHPQWLSMRLANGNR